MRRARATRRDRRQHQRLTADSREPVGVPVDVGELGAANVVVMKDRVGLTGDDAHPVAPDQELGLVTAVGEKTGWPGLDRGDAERPNL